MTDGTATDRTLQLFQFAVFLGVVINVIFLVDYFLAGGNPEPYTLTHSLFPDFGLGVFALVSDLMGIIGLTVSNRSSDPGSRRRAVLIPFVVGVLYFLSVLFA